MRRLLACLAVVSAGGCTCFNGEYSRFCDATSKCGPRSLDLPNLEQDQRIWANYCQANLSVQLLGDEGQMIGRLSPPVKVTFEPYPENGLEMFSDGACGVPAGPDVTFEYSGSNLSFVTRQVGRVSLTVSAAGIAPTGRDVNSQGMLTWSPVNLSVPVADCDAGVLATLKVHEVNKPSAPLQVAHDIDVQVVLPGGIRGEDLDGTCTGTPTVRFLAGTSGAQVRLAGMGATGSQVMMTVDAGLFFVEPLPRAWVGAGCSVPGDSCSSSTCCNGLNCNGGTCCTSQGDCDGPSQCCGGSCVNGRCQ